MEIDTEAFLAEYQELSAWQSAGRASHPTVSEPLVGNALGQVLQVMDARSLSTVLQFEGGSDNFKINLDHARSLRDSVEGFLGQGIDLWSIDLAHPPRASQEPLRGLYDLWLRYRPTGQQAQRFIKDVATLLEDITKGAVGDTIARVRESVKAAERVKGSFSVWDFVNEQALDAAKKTNSDVPSYIRRNARNKKDSLLVVVFSHLLSGIIPKPSILRNPRHFHSDELNAFISRMDVLENLIGAIEGLRGSIALWDLKGDSPEEPGRSLRDLWDRCLEKGSPEAFVDFLVQIANQRRIMTQSPDILQRARTFIIPDPIRHSRK